jgi:hypothetical protein
METRPRFSFFLLPDIVSRFDIDVLLPFRMTLCCSAKVRDGTSALVAGIAPNRTHLRLQRRLPAIDISL